MHGNPAFHASFGASAIGLPAREILIDLSSAAFDLMDQVFDEGRPLATWLPGPDDDWRLTVAPRIDPETGETYGVTFTCGPAQTCRSWRHLPPESRPPGRARLISTV